MNQRALATSSRATSMPLSSSVRSDTRFPKHPPGKCLAMLCGVYDSHVSVTRSRQRRRSPIDPQGSIEGHVGIVPHDVGVAGAAADQELLHMSIELGLLRRRER